MILKRLSSLNFYNYLQAYCLLKVSIMYGSHYSDKPPKVSGDEWEEQTLALLKQIFPNKEIRRQERFPELPRAIIDFYVPSAKVAIECKACGLTPVQDKVLINHKNRQDVLKSIGITYVWWVDRERASLVPRTRKYLENVFYNCLDEKEKLTLFLRALRNRENRLT
jgi:Uma2 family endonuclease